MPMYEFICSSCETEFEELVFYSDEEVSCPKCSNTKVDKKVSAFAFKSSGRFVAASGSSCSGCSPGPSGCSGCSH
jgi:putative FmdB family regulatory protein